MRRRRTAWGLGLGLALGCGGDPLPPPAIGTSTTDTAPGSTSTEASTAAADSSASAGSDSTGEPEGPGRCAQTCEDVAECVPANGLEIDYVCDEGFCDYVGIPPACDVFTCINSQGGVCADVGGFSVCTVPCENDNECAALMQVCTGIDDAGGKFCEPPPCDGFDEGAPCEVAGVGQLGTCTDGVCACTNDAECSVLGHACRR